MTDELKIFSSNNGSSYLSIRRAWEYGYDVEVLADIGHGRFQARNTDLVLMNIPEFTVALDRLISNRSSTARLEGTYDSVFEISGTASTVILRFRLGDAFAGYDKTEDYSCSGAFSVDEQYLTYILNYFRGQLES